MEELTSNGSLFQNWVRCAKALNIACDPLAKFVEPVNRRLHQDVLQNVQTVPSRTSCSFRNAERCPSKVCNKLKFEILNTHRFQRPVFSNTELSSCWTDHWELAKCYMSPGYKDIHTATETDFSGFINLVINHTHFQQELKVNLSDPNNVFIQAREVRNSIMHNSRLEVTPFSMFLFLNIVVRLLKEIKEGLKLQASDQNNKDLQIRNVNLAIFEIRKISSNKVSEEETHDILLQANRAMRRMRFEIKEAIQATSEECRKSLRRTVEIGKLDIRITTSVCRKMIKIVGKELIKRMVEQTEKACIVIESKISQTLEKMDNGSKQDNEVVENELENSTQDSGANDKAEKHNNNFYDTDKVSKKNLAKIIGEIKQESDILPETGHALLDKLTNVETRGNSTHNIVEESKNILPKVCEEMEREPDILPDVEHFISNELSDVETNNSIIRNTTKGTKSSLTKIIGKIKRESDILPEIGQALLDKLTSIETHKDSIHNAVEDRKNICPKVNKEINRESDILPNVGNFISDELTDIETNKTPIHNTTEGNKNSLTKIIEEIKQESDILQGIGQLLVGELAEAKTEYINKRRNYVESVEAEFNQSRTLIDTKSIVEDFTKWIEQINQQVIDVPAETNPFSQEAFGAGGERHVDLSCDPTKEIKHRNRKSVPRDHKQTFELDERLEIKPEKGKRYKKMIDVEETGFTAMFNRACASL